MADNSLAQKVGVLGGGQLGRMLYQAALDFNIDVAYLDSDAQAPCSFLKSFENGSIKDFETVKNFGIKHQVVTIEIEHVNVDALKYIEQQGVKVFPQPHIIELIQDKRKQKQFYQEYRIPTAEFILVENKNDVQNHLEFLPAVNKLGKDGYDGRGVQILKSKEDISKAFDAPGLLEKLINFEKEIAILVARNEAGDIVSYPAVEMVFHPEKNLVEYLFAPAQLSGSVLQEADRIAKKVIKSLQLVGLLAVEMFVTKDGQVLVNEVAPRPHNSGHHTIEANITSQYEQHLRAILGLPLGSGATVLPAAMVNLLGEDGFEGPAKYKGLDEVTALPGVHVHLYGKKLTKPFRKMGHVTITDINLQALKEKTEFVKETLKVIA
ncbi:MAG: 5-(carboxyamino)imidazole ribonucleotide synthase [Cyclobacteriaceae bacterium]|jgi:5-(carboxyamino)imidazole ribonucleotide synthase|nr:5-(carboxyamino)imidazole ribonucleotide synthase [Cyclobacteriaceae bacterium]